MKLLKVPAFKNCHRLTMRRSKSVDCPKVPCGEIGHAFIVKAGGLVDIARKGKELKHPPTNKRDGAGRNSIPVGKAKGSMEAIMAFSLSVRSR